MRRANSWYPHSWSLQNHPDT